MSMYLGPVCAALMLLCAAGVAAIGDFAVVLKSAYPVSDAGMTRIYLAAAAAPLAALFLCRHAIARVGPGWTGAAGGLLVLLGFAAAGASEGRLVRLVFGLGVFAPFGAGACLAVCLAAFDRARVPPMPRALALAAVVGVGSLAASQTMHFALQNGFTLMSFFSVWGLASGLAIVGLAFATAKSLAP